MTFQLPKETPATAPQIASALKTLWCAALAFLLLACSLGCDRAMKGGDSISENSHAEPAAPSLSPPDQVLNDWPNLFGPTLDCATTSEFALDWGPEGPAELWQLPIGSGYSSPVIASDLLVQLHRLGDEEIVSCFRVEDGKLQWEFRYPTNFQCKSNYTDGPYGTPSIAQGIVITVGAEGMLHALDLQHGQLLWSHDLRQEFGVEQRIFGTGHSPLIDGSHVYLNVGGKTRASALVCFDLMTGEIRWSSGSALDGYGTPRMFRWGNRDVVIALAYDRAVGMDAETGELLWESSQPISISDAENAVTPVIDGELVLISSYGNGSSCFRFGPDGQVALLWQDRRRLTSQFNPIICRDGFAYGFHCSDHSLRCIQLETGELQWRTKTKFNRSSMVTSGPSVIFLDDRGHLVSGTMTPEGFSMISKSDSYSDDQYCFASPAVSGSRLFIKSESRLYCLDVSKR